ncbi:hypothetical protein MTO98_09480 [Mucilaginibacter sp. SMC90]|uniref:hypothetical protein n=1 Tax=Mucilaginibacter sp. SMC90 TaxID=2929803 RepID=UPI001FB4B101|nr:hypothetical protein [Mucilaginibacter sp. SMC90]UOE51308.1 hypothetical protein MTO98_09480 [Mucilaginibacter sp. SMC90]
MRFMLMTLAMLMSMGCAAQKKVDLNEVHFNEDMEAFVKDVPEIHKGNLFTTTDMFSYGVSKNSTYYFKDFLPAHVELLSYKDQLAGFSFKMKTFEDQQKVEGYLRQKYKLAFNAKETTDVTSWKYADDKIIVVLRSVPKEAFAKGMNGYLTISRSDFSAEYDRLMQR